MGCRLQRPGRARERLQGPQPCLRPSTKLGVPVPRAGAAEGIPPWRRSGSAAPLQGGSWLEIASAVPSASVACRTRGLLMDGHSESINPPGKAARTHSRL